MLALQVLLSRILGAVLFYHFGFLTISLALLGAGAGAILVYVRPGWFERRALEPTLALWAAAFAVLLAVTPLLLVRLDYTFENDVTAGFALTLALVCVIAALPFLAGGIVVALAIKGYVAVVGRLYAFDLAGAALGAVGVVPLLWLIEPARLSMVLGLVAAGAAVLFAGGAARERVAALAAAGVVALALVLALATDVVDLDPNTTAPEGLEPVSDVWNPLSRVIGYPPPGDSRFALVFYDRIYAPVPVWRRGTPSPGYRQLGLGPQSIGYAMAGPGRALVIGGGGGRDIHNALSSGQRQVDVIELNRDIRDTVDGPLRRWSGAPYSLPRVNTVIGDGRSTLASRDTKYDQIHIGFTDTLSASSAQAYALTEANLYTVEAFRQYLDHLKPNGVLNVSRLRRLTGDEALRTTVLALEALRADGVKQPERHVVVVMGKDIFGEEFGTVLTRKRPWTAAQLARIRALARERGDGVAFAPGGPYQLEWKQLAAASSPQAFCQAYRFDVCAPTDDKPFFFAMKRFQDIGQALPAGYYYSIDPLLVLLITLGILAVLSSLGFLLPLAFAPRADRPPVSSLWYFAALGTGFLLLEIALVQRFVLFLGFPTYALSVVLFALLLFTGLGAYLTTRTDRPRTTLIRALVGAVVVIVLAALVLEPLLEALISAPFALRVALTVLLLAPVAMLLGTAMPLGLQRMAGLYPAGVPWAWGINGVMSVLAPALAVVVALRFGFQVTTLLAGVCYAGALALAATGTWPSAGSRPAEPVQ